MFEETYKTKEEIPAAVLHLYVEKDGLFSLIQMSDMKTKDDVARVQDALRKEREDHKEIRQKLALFNGLVPEEVHTKLDRIEELETAADGKLDEDKIDRMVEKRLVARTAPLDRQIANLTSERDAVSAEVIQYKETEQRRTIHDSIRTAGLDAKIHESAMVDAMLIAERVFEVDENGDVLTKDGVGVTPGVQASVWLTEMKATRAHWWPSSNGVGAVGGNGNSGVGHNPFTHEDWNLTEQGALVKEDPVKARQMAKAAGTVLGGSKPSKK